MFPSVATTKTGLGNLNNPMAVHRTALSWVRGDPSEHLEQQDNRQPKQGFFPAESPPHAPKKSWVASAGLSGQRDRNSLYIIGKQVFAEFRNNQNRVR